MDFQEDVPLAAFPGEQLRALRRSLGVSQRHLAEVSGVDQAVVCRLERGTDALWTTWQRLFVALGYGAVLMPVSAEDAEDFLQDGIQRRKDRMEAGRMARWG